MSSSFGKQTKKGQATEDAYKAKLFDTVFWGNSKLYTVGFFIRILFCYILDVVNKSNN